MKFTLDNIQNLSVRNTPVPEDTDNGGVPRNGKHVAAETEPSLKAELDKLTSKMKIPSAKDRKIEAYEFIYGFDSSLDESPVECSARSARSGSDKK